MFSVLIPVQQPIRLMLNCVGGPDTTAMTRLLGDNAHLVSYGAMSKKPLSLPTSAFIFKNLSAQGFWQSRWYNQHTRKEREDLMKTLAGFKVRLHRCNARLATTNEALT